MGWQDKSGLPGKFNPEWVAGLNRIFQSIEIFEKKDGQDEAYDTLGEHFFVQVKGIANPTIKKKIISDDTDDTDDTQYEIDVITFSIDTVELFTIQKMGNGVPVLLFIVDTSNKKIYFLNVNDYIDKILLLDDPGYHSKNHKTIYIPIQNCICNEKDLFPLKYYSVRPKLYSAFLIINYQYNDFRYTDSNKIIELYKRYANELLTYDIWNKSNIWEPLESYKTKLLNLIQNKDIGIFSISEDDDVDKCWEFNGDERFLFTKKEINYLTEINVLWEQMNSLHGVYESLHRKYFLPTLENCLFNE